MMTGLEVFTIVLGIAELLVGIIIWLIALIIKSMLADIKVLEKKMEDIPKEYVLKTDYKDVLERIFSRVDAIFEKLDKKVDKPGDG